MSRRILHVIPAVAPRYGGPSAATIGMCHALRRAGMSTLVATTDADGRGRLGVSAGEVQAYAGVPMVFFPRQASEAYKWSAPLAAWLRDHVKDFDLAHIHAVFSHSSVAAGRACLDARVPYVVRPLGTLDPWSLGRHRWRKRLLLHLGAGRLLAGAAAIHYTTDEERRLAETSLAWLPHGAVIPLGVDEELFASPTDAATRGPYVLALCRLDPKKGVDLLIQAFHDLADAAECLDWTLVIAGDGDPAYVSRLQRAADAGLARSRIVFRGWVDRDARAALLHGASVFALPSHQENFGIAVVEAMACGVPVVVSPRVNLAGAIDSHRAGWVVPRDRAALAAGLRLAMSDRLVLREYGARARAFAAQFQWSAVADALGALYHAILSRRTVAVPRLDAQVDTAYRPSAGGEARR